MSANEPERNALADELADLHRRLGEGIFYTEYDEDSRLMGVLRRHIDALRAGEAGKQERDTELDKQYYLGAMGVLEVMASADPFDRQGWNDVINKEREKQKRRFFGPQVNEGRQHGDQESVDDGFNEAPAGEHAADPSPAAQLLTPFWCDWWRGVIADAIARGWMPGLTAKHDGYVLLCEQAKLATLTAERAPGAEQKASPVCYRYGYHHNIYEGVTHWELSPIEWNGQRSYVTQPLYAATQPDLAGK